MNDTEPFDDLDRRAATAVAALDRAVDAAPIPERPHAGTATRTARWSIPPIAVAAGLLLVALVAAGLLFTGGDEESTIAAEVDFTHLALPDPGALGYRIEAVSDGRQGAGAPADGEFAMTATVQGPSDADDPWSEAIVSYSLPSESTTLDGEPVDIGGPEAYFSDGGVDAVGWIDGDETRYLRSTRVARDQLVAIATEAVSDGGPADQAIPGQQVLYTGTLADVFPSAITMGRGGDVDSMQTATVVYVDASDEGQRVLAVSTSPGTEDDLRAGNVLAESTREVTVRGRDAVLGSFFGGRLHVSWLEPDGTLARADAIGATDIDADTLVDHLDRLEAVSPATFARLADDVPSESERDTATEIDDNVLASAQVESDGETLYAELLRSEDDELSLEAGSDGPQTSGATGAPVASLDEPTVVRHDSGAASVIAGVVGSDVSNLALDCVDATRCDLEYSGPSTASIEGSNSVLFIAVVPGGEGDYVVTGTRRDGTAVRIVV